MQAADQTLQFVVEAIEVLGESSQFGRINMSFGHDMKLTDFTGKGIQFFYMRRRAFNLAVLICLAVEIGLVAEWVRSYWVKDEIVVRRDMVLPGTFHSFFEEF